MQTKPTEQQQFRAKTHFISMNIRGSRSYTKRYTYHIHTYDADGDAVPVLKLWL